MNANFRLACLISRLLATFTIVLLVHPSAHPSAHLSASQSKSIQSGSGPIILSFEGEVEVRRLERTPAVVRLSATATAESLTYHDRLFPGDTIVTGRNGRAVLGLPDGSQAVVAPKTTVRIENLSATPRHIFDIIRGKTRISIEKPGGRPNPYRVNTPTTVIAVRGTVFDVVVGNEQTDVYLHEGEVEVINRSIPDQMLRLLPGQSTRVTRFRPPIAPRIFSAGKNDRTFRLRSTSRRQNRTRPPRLSGLPGFEDVRVVRANKSGTSAPGDRVDSGEDNRTSVRVDEPRVGQREPGAIWRRSGGAGRSPGASPSHPGGRRF